MKIKKWAISVIALSLVGLGPAQPALAQTGEESDEGGLLEEIIITATKREESIFNVPMSVRSTMPCLKMVSSVNAETANGTS